MFRSSPLTSWTYFLLLAFALFVDAALHWGADARQALLFNLFTGMAYAFFYLLPLVLLDKLAGRFMPTFWPRARAVALIGLGALTLLALHGDLTLYRLYGFHFNGFVWNLLTTPGGIASLGMGESTYIGFAVQVAGVLVLCALMYFAAGILAARLVAGRAGWQSRRGWLVAIPVAAGLVVSSLVYAIADVRNNGYVMASADAWPGYVPVTARHFIEGLGVEAAREVSVDNPEISVSAALSYPLNPLQHQAVQAPPNIVMLVAESLRWDMLTPEIMPYTSRFAAESLRFNNHYSGGNTTRHGLFGLFYGIYGTNWNNFLYAQRSPLLIDEMIDDGYDLKAYTSASFTYPEFDLTIFSRFPEAHLIQNVPGAAWQRDVKNVDALIADIDAVDEGVPFFRFMFFESTHASYDFPEQEALRKNYIDGIDYSSLDPEEMAQQRALYLNRYINAAHHVDKQIGRFIDWLKASGKMENTIVLIAGDHGEEFMENGHWGHNSSFAEYQTRTPFILHVPGLAPAQFDQLSSHLDFVPTIMPLLGVSNPARDYCLGRSLLTDPAPDFIGVGSWTDIGYISKDYKYYVPIESGPGKHDRLTTRADLPVTNRQNFLAKHLSQVLQLINNQARFLMR